MKRKINLFSGYFKCDDKERQKELDYCLDMNLNNPVIDNVITFSARPKYSDFFNETRKRPEDINIFANADIFFNQTLKRVHVIRPYEAFALTRWEWVKGKIIPFNERHGYNRGASAKHSQDAWVFCGAAQPIYGEFFIGIPGCDNRIAYEIQRAGYRLYNPCLSIQCIHKHDEEERAYNIPAGEPERIRPPYRWVDPCTITYEGYSVQVPASPHRSRRSI